MSLTADCGRWRTMVDCKICGHPLCSYAGAQRGIVVDCSGYMPRPKPQTNADRIRAMSDEELAEFMAERYDREHTARILGELFGRGYAPDQTMRRALHEKVRLQWLGWLRQPIKEGEGDGEA